MELESDEANSGTSIRVCPRCVFVNESVPVDSIRLIQEEKENTEARAEELEYRVSSLDHIAVSGHANTTNRSSSSSLFLFFFVFFSFRYFVL